MGDFDSHCNCNAMTATTHVTKPTNLIRVKSLRRNTMGSDRVNLLGLLRSAECSRFLLPSVTKHSVFPITELESLIYDRAAFVFSPPFLEEMQLFSVYVQEFCPELYFETAAKQLRYPYINKKPVVADICLGVLINSLCFCIEYVFPASKNTTFRTQTCFFWHRRLVEHLFLICETNSDIILDRRQRFFHFKNRSVHFTLDSCLLPNFHFLNPICLCV
jgi:hypothetical protein